MSSTHSIVPTTRHDQEGHHDMTTRRPTGRLLAGGAVLVLALLGGCQGDPVPASESDARPDAAADIEARPGDDGMEILAYSEALGNSRERYVRIKVRMTLHSKQQPQ